MGRLKLSFFLLLFFLVGCASVNKEKYTSFHREVTSSNAALSESMQDITGVAHEVLVERISKNPKYKVSELYIESGSGYEWKMEYAPLYIKLRQAARRQKELSDIFLNYSLLLNKLADNENVSAEYFQKLALEMNESTSRLTKNTNKAGLAIFSSATIQLLKMYANQKRAAYLTEAVAANQETVEKYTHTCIELNKIITGLIQNIYNERYLYLPKEFRESASNTERGRLAKDILKLNDDFIDQLSRLSSIEEIFKRLNISHSALMSEPHDNVAYLKNHIQEAQKTKENILNHEVTNE